MKPIDQLSLGWRTHLIFPRFDAQVIERADYLLVRTPHNPTFWWGNFLLFDHVPEADEATRWLAWFEAEFAEQRSASGHTAFGVDSDQAFGMPDALLRADFTCYADTVLTIDRGEWFDELCDTAALPAGFRIAALDLPAQSALAVEQQVASDQGHHQPVAGYRAFRQRQMVRYTAMQQAALGHWFGVFAEAENSSGHSAEHNGGQGEELVADCGLFRDGAGPQALGRFQYVSTHPAWRRRGLCRALIHAVCRHGFEVMGLQTLVIVADPDDVAIGLYESVGFRRGSSTWHFERQPGATGV